MSERQQRGMQQQRDRQRVHVGTPPINPQPVDDYQQKNDEINSERPVLAALTS
jgi:hypothetical protein